MSVTVRVDAEADAGTIPERIFSLLREAIVEGAIPAGSKISEPELARAYGISRGPLREAIGRLEACGLVVRRPNLGARVVTLSNARLIEIFHVREALEGMAARLAAQHMSDTEIAELRGLLSQHGEQIERDAGQAYFQREGDLDFHYRIVKGSHNGRLVDLLCNDLYHLVRLYRYQFGMQSKRAPRAFIEHGHIVDAIERRDPEMAELMMRAHVRASRENVERLLRGQGDAAGGARQGSVIHETGDR
jgi:DNA-binding GntR family transcriptional regulator